MYVTYTYMHTCERNTAPTYTLSLTTWHKITGIQNYTSTQEHAPVICKHLYDCTHSDITQPLVVFPIMICFGPPSWPKQTIQLADAHTDDVSMCPALCKTRVVVKIKCVLIQNKRSGT